MIKNDQTPKILPLHGHDQAGTQGSPVARVRKHGNDFGAIIREYRMKSGLDQSQVSAALGFSRNTVSNWENGIRRPDVDVIADLCEYLHIPLDVFFGISSSSSPVDELELVRIYRTLNKYGKSTARQVLLSLADNQQETKFALMRAQHCRLEEPALASSAGTGEPLDEMDEPSYTYVVTSYAATHANKIIHVNGDSMEPTIPNGASVYVKDSTTIEPGQIGIFVSGGDAFIKEYQPDGLHSHNPKYPVIHPGDDEYAHCVGIVLGIVHPAEIIRDNSKIALLDKAFAEGDND